MLLAAVVLLCWAGAGAQPLRLPEYQIKAVYLLNFTRYVHWPASAFEDEHSAFNVCIFGPDRFGARLDRTMAERTSHGRPLRVNRITEVTEATECHVLFIGREADAARNTLRALRGQPILTVGEASHFLNKGGGVELVIVGDTVQFGINLDATGAAGLTVSSRMLSLARRVIGSRKPGGAA